MCIVLQQQKKTLIKPNPIPKLSLQQQQKSKNIKNKVITVNRRRSNELARNQIMKSKC